MTSQNLAAPISETQLRRRMMGCWLGKAVGGTLGMPYEGVRHTLDLSYYDPVPTEMLPNDDLDLQVIYAFLLERMDQPRVDRQVLSRAWSHLGMSPDEYGIVKRNLALGLTPPTTGAYDNPFTRGMGAAIRTELWACLAPGDPDTAVRFAYEDACMDHAGEGIHAATFLAALQSLAFVESDREVLLERALAYIPAAGELIAAIRDTRAWWAQSRDWKAVQARLADRYLTDNFTDVVLNLAYIVLGWLAGEDFGRAICIAVNCGQDTDCTGATLGALLGILDPEGIEDRWLQPIGRDLVLSPCVTGVEHPSTLDGFTELVMQLRGRLDPSTPDIPEKLEDTAHLAIPATLGFVDAMPDGDAEPALPDDAHDVRFPGNWVQLPPQQCPGNVALVRYRFTLDEACVVANGDAPGDASGGASGGTSGGGGVQLFFCSPQPVRVWVDGRLTLDSPGGQFVPALHRTRPAQGRKLLQLAAGEHTLTAAVHHADNTRSMQWVIALADDHPRPVERNWLVDPLRHPVSRATARD